MCIRLNSRTIFISMSTNSNFLKEEEEEVAAKKMIFTKLNYCSQSEMKFPAYYFSFHKQWIYILYISQANNKRCWHNFVACFFITLHSSSVILLSNVFSCCFIFHFSFFRAYVFFSSSLWRCSEFIKIVSLRMHFNHFQRSNYVFYQCIDLWIIYLTHFK